MSVAIRLQAEPVRSLAAGVIGVGYMGVGTELEYPARIISVQNLTDATLMFSFNGVDDHFPLPADGFLLLDITGNRTVSTGFFIAESTRLYVKLIDEPTTGSVYFTSFYGETN